MQYLTRQLKVGKSARLDELAHEAGAVYTKTLVTFWRVVRHSDHWLSRYAMQRLIRSGNLHSQTTQGIVETFYEALASWRSLRKIDPDAKPPRRRNWYHAVPFKAAAIRLSDGVLKLSTGSGNEPILLPWKYGLPKFCEISFNGREYVLNATYALEDVEASGGNGVAGVDLGEIHLAVVDTGGRVLLANGRALRSKRRYQNKAKGHFQKMMDKCEKQSRRWRKLNKAKKRALGKLDNQIRDILHKQTTSIVCAMKEDGVQTVGIGDVRDLLKNVDYGAKANQKIHQMPSGKARQYITYKARRAGMAVALVGEAHSSQTCPKCGSRNKTSTRNYRCRACGLEYHRDGVGAVNIRSKTMYREYVPVVGDMTPPVGIRYYANSSCKSAAKAA
ncbi:MAG: transposase [Deltaproteobacteria bacterium]|nr:transposase [Deltaproteobacteria bacterium]